MRRKKILIISYGYPPSNVPAAQRPHAVARYLNKEEFDVTVVTCGNRDNYWGINEGFNPELPEVKLITISSIIGGGMLAWRNNTEKVKVKRDFINRLKRLLFRFLSSLIVPDKAIFWYPRVRKYLLQNKILINETDVVFTTSPSFSNHLLGKFIKSRGSDIFWVCEFRDFHFIETVESASNIKQIINKRLEYNILKHADKVSFISHSMREIYSNHFNRLSNKFGVIYNGFDLTDFRDLDIHKIINERLTIFYAGSFYKGVRSPIPLLKILDNLIEKRTVSAGDIEIRIAGNFESELYEDIKKYNSFVFVNFIGKIPRSEVLSHLVSSDLLWLIVGNKSTHYTGVPIKFFEYLGARRPIINFAPKQSEPTKIISQNKLGWSFDTASFDLERSTEIFEHIIENYRRGLLSDRLEKKVIPEFDRRHQGILFGELFDKY